MNDLQTDTSRLQAEIEELVTNSYNQSQDDKLRRAKHEIFLRQPLLEGLNRWFVSLDASKPWLLYWILHSLDLLGLTISEEIQAKSIETLNQCKDSSGGYSGGCEQLAHLATTYAAVSALAIIGTPEAFSSINRDGIYSFLMRMKQADGSFRMHEMGEIDIRGSYCALNVAVLLNILTPELTENVENFILRCQTYEGGLGPCPGVECHGGYTFCGLAAIAILNKTHLLNLDLLMSWLVSRQMKNEGGFQGRTNKLVDGCYSFWQGSALALLAAEFNTSPLFERGRLQDYIYLCCQKPSGGLRDKPGKSPDYYHSCYCLSGASVCQYHYSTNSTSEPISNPIALNPSNKLKPTHPIHNIAFQRVQPIQNYFKEEKVNESL